MCHSDTWNQVAKEKRRTLVNESWESLGVTMSPCASEDLLQMESEFQPCDSNRNAYGTLAMQNRTIFQK